MSDLFDAIFALSPLVRYVARGGPGEPVLRERPGITNASGSESDRYEELLVNPTVLTLLQRRGRIDCGGLEYVLIRYGSFFQIVWPLPDGHLSVAVEPWGDPLEVAAALRERVPALAAEGVFR